MALFHQVGMQVHGRPLNPPNIIFWNVRADTFGYPAAADQKGVMLLSGYSPALMKFILSGEMEEEVATALVTRAMSSRLAGRWILVRPCSACWATRASMPCAPS